MLAKSCEIKKDKIILCPGNHDISRKDSDRNEKIQKYRNGGVLPNIEACLEGYGKFRELYSLVFARQYKPFTTKI